MRIAKKELKNKHIIKVSTQKKTTMGLWSALLFFTVNLYTNSV
ncbi:hypothetical protein PMAN_a0609 [Pseudoalteromonas marina]|nr:hypothetical protein PMAN_a0609 [Pseudoalteromonas marina]